MSIKKEESPVIFPAQGLSPRLKWIEKHGITMRKTHGRFYAQKGAIQGIGSTENDALADMCQRHNTAYSSKIHLWNEEEFVEAMAAKSTSIISKS